MLEVQIAISLRQLTLAMICLQVCRLLVCTTPSGRMLGLWTT